MAIVKAKYNDVDTLSLDQITKRKEICEGCEEWKLTKGEIKVKSCSLFSTDSSILLANRCDKLRKGLSLRCMS